MRQRMWSEESLHATIDAHVDRLMDGYTEPVGNREPDSIQNPVARHFREYPRLGTPDWPNVASVERRIDSYQGQIDYLKDWMFDRFDWMDDQSMVVNRQIYRAPIFSHLDSESDAPIELEITRHKGGLFDANKFPDGPIYYTTDGSDPRLPGGAVNDAAMEYDGVITVDRAQTITARLLNGENWTPKTTATFTIGTKPASSENLVISEIMYRPSDPTPIEDFAGIKDNAQFEFIELTNISDGLIDLTGVHFTNGIRFDFASVAAGDRILQPGQSIILVHNGEGFSRRNKDVPYLGEYKGKLDNGGERITLVDAEGNDIQDFRYDDDEPWTVEADGAGYSLVLVNPSHNPDPDEVESWARSAEIGGNPTTTPDSDGGGNGNGGGGFTGDPDADSDGDGLTDYYEYVFGEDTRSPLTVELVEQTEDNMTVHYAQVRHLMNSNAQGIEYVLEKSTNLNDWETIESPQVVVDDSGEFGTYTHSEPVTEDLGPLVFRVKAVQSP